MSGFNEWVKCSERFPEEGEDVLIWDGRLNLDNVFQYDIATYRIFNNGSFFVSGSYVLKDITHWMPLPLPPKD